MPFELGNKLAEGQGRKGYEIEEAQKETMRRILDKDLKIIERLQDAEDINPIDKEKLLISQARVGKYLDKLHVSRTATDITTKGESINITPESLAVAKKYEEELNKLEDGKD